MQQSRSSHAAAKKHVISPAAADSFTVRRAVERFLYFAFTALHPRHTDPN
jgi:hypothetical protein